MFARSRQQNQETRPRKVRFEEISGNSRADQKTDQDWDNAQDCMDLTRSTLRSANGVKSITSKFDSDGTVSNWRQQSTALVTQSHFSIPKIVCITLALLSAFVLIYSLLTADLLDWRQSNKSGKIKGKFEKNLAEQPTVEQDTPYFPETADVDSVPEYTEEDLTKRDPLLANILRRSQGELYTQNDRELYRIGTAVLQTVFPRGSQVVKGFLDDVNE